MDTPTTWEADRMDEPSTARAPATWSAAPQRCGSISLPLNDRNHWWTGFTRNQFTVRKWSTPDVFKSFI
jgi:hypothetical protein